MRILVGIPFLYPALSYGGAARSAYHLAEALQELGHEITVLTTDVWDASSRYTPNGFHAPFEVIRVPNLSNKIAYYWQFYTPMGILKHAERLVAQSDILHLHTFRNLVNDLMARTAVKQRVPFVLTGHGTIPRIERFFLIKEAYDFLIGKWQLRNASGYIAVTRAERKAMLRFGLDREKIHVIPNGIGSVRRSRPDSFRRQWGIGADEKIILFLGKITPRKGVQHLVRAFSRLRKKARLVIAGNDMGYASQIRALITRYRISDRVLWTGLLDDDRKAAALREADVTVYPSTNEVFGLVPLESILAGTPVVVCDDHGCGEIVRKTGAGTLVPWGDAGALTDAITRQLNRGKNQAELQTAKAMIRKTYRWRRIARRVERFYFSCLDPKASPPARCPREKDERKV